MAGEAHPFGEAVPGEAVTIPDFNPMAGYIPHGEKRFVRMDDGQWRRVDHVQKERTMTTAIAERQTVAVTAMPKDQLELVRRTVAMGATNDELALFLYDCDRRGIHPLDKLLHFTKRGGKYTPVTSIDFMRSQAAVSGEMAGSDDPVFTMDGERVTSATVTVYRMTQGQRFAYTATARWSEYCPDNAPMWRRMPHTMLGKCAEALALRKAFPHQLAGLYSREEMEQAEPLPVNSYPSPQPVGALTASTVKFDPNQPTTDGLGRTSPKSDDGPNLGTADPDNLPEGYRLIDEYRPDGDWHHVTWGRDAQGGWMTYKTKLAKVGLAAKDAYDKRHPVRIVCNKFPFLDKVESLGMTPEQIDGTKFKHADNATIDAEIAGRGRSPF